MCKLSVSVVSSILFVFANGAFTLQATESKQTTIYYDYLPFSKAYETQTTESVVSAPNLLLLKHLSNKVGVEFLPTTRLMSELNNVTERSVCSLFKLKTDERSEKFYFSLPVSFILTNRLYLKRDMPPIPESLLNEDGELKSLLSLFNGNDNVIMLWDIISYGSVVDEALETIPDKNKIIIQGLSSHGSLARMIERDRTDYAIMFPSEVTDFENDATPLNLLSYRIAGVNPISTGHVMCNKNQASKDFLLTVNNKLIELYRSPSFIKANTLNVSPKDTELLIKEIKKNTPDMPSLM